MGNTTPVSDTGTLTINKNMTVNSTKKIITSLIECPLYNSTNATTLMEIAKTSTTANINIGGVQTSGNIVLGNATPASDSGTLTINKNMTVSSGKSVTLTSGNITLSSGKILNNVYTGTSSGTYFSLGEVGDVGTIQSYRSLYIGTQATNKILYCNLFYSHIGTDSISFGLNQTSGSITIGNSTPASDTGTLFINKNMTVSTGKSIAISTGTLNCNTYTATTTSTNFSLGQSGDTGYITSTRDLLVGTVALNKGIYCNYFTPLQNTDNLNFSNSQTTGNINIQPSATSGNIFLGNLTSSSDSGTLTINKNTVMPTDKTFKCDNYQESSANTTWLAVFETIVKESANVFDIELTPKYPELPVTSNWTLVTEPNPATAVTVEPKLTKVDPNIDPELTKFEFATVPAAISVPVIVPSTIIADVIDNPVNPDASPLNDPVIPPTPVSIDDALILFVPKIPVLGLYVRVVVSMFKPLYPDVPPVKTTL